MKVTVPGKVFLIGEYACLWGGPAILAAVHPNFELTVRKIEKRSGNLFPFAMASPAGTLFLKNKRALTGLTFKWKKSSLGKKGIGSSSAEFVALFRTLYPNLPRKDLAMAVWRTFRKVTAVKGQLPPSGLDVLVQTLGGVHVFEGMVPRKTMLPRWNHRSAEWVLIWTGKKVRTHEHLKALGPSGLNQIRKAVGGDLNATTKLFKRAWMKSDAKTLGFCLNHFQDLLEGVVPSPESYKRKICEIQKLSGVYGCKGAGAQGGDCLLALVDRKKLSKPLRHSTRLKFAPKLS